jgi:hypothetical protein
MSSKLPESVNLDTNGVVVINTGVIRAWMHPYSFRDIYGEEAYQELLKRPRVQSEYTEEELNENHAFGFCRDQRDNDLCSDCEAIQARRGQS